MLYVCVINQRVTQMKSLKVVGILALPVAILVGCVLFEVSLWNECRQTNRFFYCLRVLGR